MVSLSKRLIFAAGCSLWFAGPLSAREPNEYRLGDTIEADIVAPIPLKVVDPEATAQLREKEALRVPAIFRFDPAAADQVEEECVAAFANTRSNLLQRIDERFGRQQLDAAALETTKFQRIVGGFLSGKKGAPLTTNLAELWARGESGSAVEALTLARVRAMMERPLRADFLPAGFKFGPQLRVVTVTNANETLTVEDTEQRGRLTARTNVLALGRARKELQMAYPPEEEPLARFAALALRINCFPEATLTAEARSRRSAPFFLADSYEAGQVIASRGQVVNAKIKAALEQLHHQATVAHLERQVGEQKAITSKIHRRDQWLWTGLAILTLALIPAFWWLARRRKPVSFVPARVAGDGSSAAVIACPSCEENIVVPAGALGATAGAEDAWQQRALAAEQRAERAQAAIRAGVLPQFVEWLKHTFVRGLVSQRSQMLEAQKTAAAEMAEMERRLDELHAPLQERLRAYEKRITELEKLLAARGKENRKLLRAKIQMTRQQLEAERTRHRAELN